MRFMLRRLRWSSVVVALALVAGLFVFHVGILAAPALAASPATVTFSFTGSNQSWTAPAGVTSVKVDIRGAQGAAAASGGQGAPGGRVVATVPVTPGTTLVVVVGGTDGTNGGGVSPPGNYGGNGGNGGGASDVRQGGSALSNRIVVAGGGGGEGFFATTLAGQGGAGGGPTGQAGSNGSCSTGGGGATTSAGGSRGSGSDVPGASAGSLGQGGQAGMYDYSGGGGGGGYYGGGGGGSCDLHIQSGGGGGSSYVEAGATSVTEYQGYNNGNGLVIISYVATPATPDAAAGSASFTTPGLTTWTVPAGVSSLQVDARGSAGSGGASGGSGGSGGGVVATVPVKAGETLTIVVGGTDGTNGGGSAPAGYNGGTGGTGGGATDVREGGNQLSNRVIVAGGGGGNGFRGAAGGMGGGATGLGGANGSCSTGGGGGTQSGGGAAGTSVDGFGSSAAWPGVLGAGGQGGDYDYSGGGGGAGYYGGGGGGSCDLNVQSGGGGGSSYVEAAASGVQQSPGTQAGNGAVTLSWNGFIPTGGPIPTATIMASNPSVGPRPCSTGDPVYCSTGNLGETIGDLSVPGRGIALGFSHSYNSLMAATNGPLGFGWTDSYNMSLSLGSGTPPVTATVNQENATQVGYSVTATAYVAPPWVMATLVHNGDGTWTFTRRARQIFTFNAAGQLTAEQDLNGYTTTLSYNGSGQLTTVTDPAGRTLSLGWSGSHIVGVTDTATPARSVTFGYNDGLGDLTDVIDADGGHTVYMYDANHNLVTMRAPKYYGDTTTTPTPVTTNVYNGAGQVSSQTDPLGHTTHFSYTPTSTVVTDPNGNVEQQIYSGGVLLQVTTGYGTPQAATTTYSYDPKSLGVTSVTDPDGNTTTTTTDAAGNPLSVTDPMGRTTISTYNALNEPVAVVDPSGVTTTYTYDAAGNPTSVSRPLLNASGAALATEATTYQYGQFGDTHPGDITSMTNPDNQNTDYSYSSLGDLASVTDPAGDQTTYGYDAIGRRISMVSPDGNVAGGNPAAYTTTYSYNGFGQLLTEIDALGHHVATRSYDANGNLKTSTDANGNVTSYTENPANQVILTTQANNTTLAAAYDPNGNLVTATDAAGDVTTYAYGDPALPGKATSATDPKQRTTAYAYDGAGNLLTKQDPVGNCSATPRTGCTTFGYDADNETVSTTYSDGVTPNVSTGFDALGHRVTMTDGTGTSSYVWDSLGRMTSSTTGVGATVGYGYDLAGRKTSIAYPGGAGTVTQGFDAAGRLHIVSDWEGHTTVFNYDADSNPTTEVYPNGTTSTVTTNAAGQVTGIADTSAASPSTPFISFAYGRDSLGQETSVAATGVPADSNSYSYTQLNQLQNVNSPSSAYAYDHANNLVHLASGGAQGFDAASQLCWSTPSAPSGSPTCSSPPAGATTYGYNVQGDRTSATPASGPASSYSYDQANRLTSVQATPATPASGNGVLKVVVSPALPSLVSVDGQAADTGGLSLSIMPGSHQVCFGTVTGYAAPACQTPVVAPGQITTVTGTFTSQAPTVSGIAAASGPTTGGTSVTISGTNLAGAYQVRFGTVLATITADSSTQVVAISPAGSAGGVDVTVTTPAGTSPTGASDQFIYVVPPAVNGIAPSTGPTAGGTSVTISGTNLAGATAVDFGASPGTITSNTPTQVVATSPAGSAGTVDVTVTTPVGGTSAPGSSDRFSYAGVPAVSGIAPTAGPTAGGSSVTISGANLAGATAVHFGATAGTIISDSASQLVATSPAGSVATVDVTVTTPGGTSHAGGSDRFSYAAAPSVSAIAPGQGPTTGGTSVSIVGSNLAGATSVNFGTTAGVITSDSASQIVATSPTNAAGSVDITVTTPGGTSPTTSLDTFVYTYAAPVVSSVSPAAGPTAGGTTVTIAGTSLANASAVDFGSTAATIISDSASQIVATAPAGSAGTVDVTVTTAQTTSVGGVTITSGGSTSAISAEDHYSYLPVAAVSGLSPSSGPTTGGTSVTISGSDLAGATAVAFGTTVGTITADSGTQIVVTAPSEAAGSIDVTVTTPGGTSATGSADRFTYTQAAPVVSSVSPSAGSTAGGTTVTISGGGLAGATSVHFGGAAGSIVSSSPTQIVATSPGSAAGGVDVTVTTPGGTSATGSADRFTFTQAAPVVSSVSPSSGPTAGGTTVTIAGTSLAGATSVHFGSGVGAVLSDSPTQIVASSPASGPGSVDVTVTTPGGTSSTGPADTFAYLGVPTVAFVSPSSGPATGGSIVVIDGTNLGGAIAVDFGATPGTILGDLPNQIVVSAPAGAAGADDVTVTTPGGTSATGASDQFTYLPSLSRLQVAPSPALLSTISVDGIPRDNGSVDIVVAPGAHQVCFGPVSGHSPPPCQLVVTAVGSSSAVTGTFDAPTTYAYNGDGLRASATHSGITAQQTWDVSGSLPLLLAENTGSAATDFIYGPGGIPFEQIQPNGAASFYYRDVQGSTVGVADASGNVVATVTYDPYGNPTATVGSFATPLGYDGQMTDAESGLTYLRARYYDPGTGQFMSRDPLVAITGSAYGYGGDDPLNGRDPSGLWFGIDDIVASVAGAVVGGTTSVIEQAASGNGINWAKVGISAGVGAAGAEASLYCGPLCGGAIAGGLNEAGNEIYSGNVNPVHIAAATATGGLLGWGVGSLGWNGGSLDQAPAWAQGAINTTLGLLGDFLTDAPFSYLESQNQKTGALTAESSLSCAPHGTLAFT